MPTDWPTRRHSVASLHLDTKNPRLGRETTAKAPREIVQYLFEHDKALDVAQSIAKRGYFPNEPLLAVKENDQLVVVEGNRRLAALKALKEPGLLDGRYQRQVERLSRQLEDPNDIASVPVTIAPNRRQTDRLIAGRHIGTPVLAWEAENRASFILDKLQEGYTNARLRDVLGFTDSQIQAARQTRAIADMARSLPLSDEVKAKFGTPRVKLFTTIERVFNSKVGREYLRVEPDLNNGIRGTTTKTEFLRGFSKLVTDVALGKASSRTLNTNEQIEAYFKKWKADERPAKKRGTFVPADVIQGRSVASAGKKAEPTPATKTTRKLPNSVLPRDFRVRYGNARLEDIRRELVALNRDKFPNAGAVLLRVFFELSVLHYFQSTGQLKDLIETLKSKNKLQYSTPTLKQLAPEIIATAKAKLSSTDAAKVEKAVTYNAAAPFTLTELHAFVHQTDLPSARDILQFWLRTEPLFRLMLEQDPKAVGK